MGFTWRFGIMILASLGAFYGIVRIALRGRPASPSPRLLGLVSILVVVGGMLFAKAGAAGGWPVWLYYGAPAAVTWFLPPLAFRMTGKELGVYVILAILIAPAVHTVFSFVLGWKEYMPFLPVPSFGELFGSST
jgi:hypothetical protein